MGKAPDALDPWLAELVDTDFTEFLRGREAYGQGTGILSYFNLAYFLTAHVLPPCFCRQYLIGDTATSHTLNVAI